MAKVLTIKLTHAEAAVALEAVAKMRRQHDYGHKAAVLDSIDRKLWAAADAAGMTETSA